jgi:hypothetical protein
MPCWLRLPFILFLLSALVFLVVIPVSVAPASAGIQTSGISSSSIDLGDDLDDNLDMMMVAADAVPTPETSHQMLLAPGITGPGPANSLDRPPDRGPPADHVFHQISSKGIAQYPPDPSDPALSSPPLHRALLQHHSWLHPFALTARRERTVSWLR